jgi:hypothetical protein
MTVADAMAPPDTVLPVVIDATDGFPKAHAKMVLAVSECCDIGRLAQIRDYTAGLAHAARAYLDRTAEIGFREVQLHAAWRIGECSLMLPKAQGARGELLPGGGKKSAKYLALREAGISVSAASRLEQLVGGHNPRLRSVSRAAFLDYLAECRRRLKRGTLAGLSEAVSAAQLECVYPQPPLSPAALKAGANANARAQARIRRNESVEAAFWIFAVLRGLDESVRETKQRADIAAAVSVMDAQARALILQLATPTWAWLGNLILAAKAGPCPSSPPPPPQPEVPEPEPMPEAPPPAKAPTDEFHVHDADGVEVWCGRSGLAFKDRLVAAVRIVAVDPQLVARLWEANQGQVARLSSAMKEILAEEWWGGGRGRKRVGAAGR